MPVILSVTRGPDKGKSFTFTEHDTFLFGRMEDCHARFPDDTQVSRHHFILEVNPPKVSLRDLGSLNGTHVNEKKWGGRSYDETPEQGATHKFPIVDLKHGDRISVGQTELLVAVVKDTVKQEVKAGMQPGELSGLSSEALQQFIFAGDKPLLKVPEFEIQKELGRGEFGAVYLAMGVNDRMRVAMKVMLSQAEATSEAVDKFKREMEINQRLEHSKIVHLMDIGSQKGAFYFIMKYCDGGSLIDFYNAHYAKNNRPLDWDILKPLAINALEGLAYAHGKGYVHRDLKPTNILVHQGVACISDFGMLRSFQMAGLGGMVMTGKTARTPLFMPPEQIINGKYAKPVSDVFSMGASLYYLLTGEYPFNFTSDRDPMDVILNDEVISIQNRNASIPQNIAEAIDRAVKKKHEERFQEAGELLLAIK